MNQQLHITAVHFFYPSDLLASYLNLLCPSKAYKRFWLVTLSKNTYLRRNCVAITNAVDTKALADAYYLPNSLAMRFLSPSYSDRRLTLMIYPDLTAEVSHSICQQVWKTQQWPQDWKRSVFIPVPKKGNAKEFSNYHITALISHASILA